MTEPATFEARHRELRGMAGGYPYADDAASDAAEQAEDALRDFYDRTGPLVDEAVGAAREMLKFGEHEGPCVLDAHTGKCTAHGEAFEEREKELASRLAALDGEAARV